MRSAEVPFRVRELMNSRAPIRARPVADQGAAPVLRRSQLPIHGLPVPLSPKSRRDDGSSRSRQAVSLSPMSRSGGHTTHHCPPPRNRPSPSAGTARRRGGKVTPTRPSAAPTAVIDTRRPWPRTGPVGHPFFGATGRWERPRPESFRREACAVAGESVRLRAVVGRPRRQRSRDSLLGVADG